MAETLLTLRDIVVRYGDSVALQLPALDLRSGEVLAIIGPNGAGKSTLLRVMGLLQRPAGGTMLFRGENAFDGKSLRLRRRIATVLQEPLLLNGTVYENAALGLKLRRLHGRLIDERLKLWLERLGIAHLSGRSARTLSGGEAQRTSLARALVLEPEILLLDEPFAALDPGSRETLLRDFQRIVKDANVTTVFVTHDRNEAFALASRIGVLLEGRPIQLGGREEVFLRPVGAAVAEIVGMENRLPGLVEESDGAFSLVRVNGNRFSSRERFKQGTKVIVCARPEDIVLRRVNLETEALNEIRGKISGISPGVAHHRITLDCEGTRVVALMEREKCLALGIAEGDNVAATLRSPAPHVIADD